MQLKVELCSYLQATLFSGRLHRLGNTISQGFADCLHVAACHATIGDDVTSCLMVS